MSQPPPRRRRGSVPRQRSTSDEEMRQGASRAIGAARRSLKAMRFLFLVDAVLVGLLLVLLLSVPDVTLLWKFAFGGLFAAAVLGAVFVVRQPVLCALPLAIFHTAAAIPVLWLGVQGITDMMCVTLAFLLWGAVAMAFNTQKLLKAYPDVWAARHMRGEGRSSDEMGSKWRDQARADRREAWKKIALYGVLPFVLAVGALVVFSGDGAENGERHTAQRPPPKPAEPVDAKLTAFQTAWNEQSLMDIRAFFAKDVEVRKARLLGKLFRRRGWVKQRAPIVPKRKETAALHQIAVFWTIEGESKVMQTDWQWESGAWWLLDLKLRIPE